MRHKYHNKLGAFNIKNLMIAIFIAIPSFLIAQIGVQEPSIKTGVQFFWSDTQTNNSDPATLEKIEVTSGGVTTEYNTFVVPSSYSLTQVGPGGHGANRIILNGGPVVPTTSANPATWNPIALAAFQDTNLNHYFSSNTNGRDFCEDFTALPFPNNPPQDQAISYVPAIPSNTDGILAVTERGGNNCYYIEVFGIPAGGGPEQLLGDTFVKDGGQNYSGGTCTFGTPLGDSDYWRSGRCNNNGQTVGVALFYLNELAPTGSSITRIEFVGSTNDHGDGKFFILQKYAVDQQVIECLDETYNGDLSILNNAPAGSTYNLVSGPTPAGLSFNLNTDGTYTYVPTPGFTGDVNFDYELCLPAPNQTNCETASATLMYVALPPEPTFTQDCSGGNTNQTITVTSPLNTGANPGQYEYSLDGGTTYQSSVNFTGLSPAGNPYNLVVRDTYTNNCERTSSSNPINLVDDTTLPTITCPVDITANTDDDGTGNCTTTANIGTPTVSDNCSVISVVAQVGGVDIDPTTYLFPLGDTTVTWIVTDSATNTAQCNQTVTVIDNEDPVAACQNITVQLDATGNATITAAQIDNGSTDNCGIASLDLDVDTFDCSNVGTNPVVLTVTDNSGNTATCNATVTVQDNINPIAICQDITVQLDATGNATITAAQIDNGSNDTCGIQSLAIDVDTFDCSNVGANTVTLTVTDGNGNASDCTATVTVQDITPPVAICQDITIQLDAAGNASIAAADIDNGSNDACGIQSLAIDVDTFDCSNVGANTVTLTVTDGNGNASDCTATVTVQDITPPVAICQDITIQLDAAGNATIAAAQIDNGSNDACGIQSLAIDVDTFDCSNVGANTVTLTVTDGNGNASDCTATVTVQDITPPVAICQDITIQLDATGNLAIAAADIDNGSNDACGIQSLAIDTTAFDCSNV
ncbi:HYR domain-containing protein, partial [Hyunsoonleella jejuensis]